MSTDWNTAENWMPTTVPNSPSDTATFGASDVTTLSINTTAVEVSTIVFNRGAAPFTITVDSGNGIVNLFITGNGIVNNSGVVQSVVGGGQAGVFLSNGATAGNLTLFGGDAGQFFFMDSASAGSATFVVTSDGVFQGNLLFFDNSTAAEATIATSDFAITTFDGNATAANGTFTTTTGGGVDFGTNSTAANGVFTFSDGGRTVFTQFATAAQGNFTAEGASASIDLGGYIDFAGSTTADQGHFVINGGRAQGARGAVMTFFEDATAGSAKIKANGGTSGGEGGSIRFSAQSDGGLARFSLTGNGNLDIGNHGTGLTTIGSIQGDGLVFLGARALAVGSNNRSTTFSGVIQDGGISQGTGGSLTKIGTGIWQLSGANTYSGGTTVSEGTLTIGNTTGSGTGSGPVQVNSGTLTGPGIIAGAVTIGSGSGTGAVLAPRRGEAQPTALTMQASLTYKADATYLCRLSTQQAKSDEVIANGVAIESGAQFTLQVAGRKRLPAGTTFTLISNTSANPIAGAFANLPTAPLCARAQTRSRQAIPAAMAMTLS